MDKNTYIKIINELITIKDKKKQLEFLDNCIEDIDYDCNGYNDDLIKKRNEINNGSDLL